MQQYSIKYPRRVISRKVLLCAARVLLKLLTRMEIVGLENIPEKGPVILAGNHVAGLEAVLLAAFSTRLVEFLGTGDIPFDPAYAWIVKVYDLIPVNRGNLDREAVKKSLEVLDQGGALGIFPEGGIWDPSHMEAKLGVALLSQRAQAPIVPIGFGGMQGALEAAFKLKRPRLVMKIGKMIPAVKLDEKGENPKVSLQKAANQIMHQINALIPEESKQQFHKVNQSFELEVIVMDDGKTVDLPGEIQVKHGSAYARLMNTPVLLDVLARNLKLPIQPLKDIEGRDELKPFLKALKSVLGYLESNPGFFNYRFGMEKGLAVKKAFEELIQLAEWVQASCYLLSLVPVHQYTNSVSGSLVIEKGGVYPRSMQ